MARSGRIGFQLATQLGHVQPQVVRLGGVRRAPNLRQQLALRHELAGVAQQHLEQPPLCRGEPDVGLGVAVVPGHPGCGQVDADVAEVDTGRLLSPVSARRDTAQPGQQLVDAERLGHVVVGPGVQRLHLVLAAAAPGQHDDRHAGPAAQLADDREAIHVRQPEVEDDDVRRLRGRGGERLGAGAGSGHRVLAGVQVHSQRPQDLRFVVDDQYAAHRRRPSAGAVSECDGPAPSTSAGTSGNSGNSGSGCVGCGAAGSDTTIVKPPPGVSSGCKAPFIASTSPRDSASPSPTPVELSRSPSRWNGANTRSRFSAGMPGPRSATRNSTRDPSALAATRGGRPGGEKRTALATRLAMTRSSRPGSASTSGKVAGTSTLMSSPSAPSSSSASGTISSRPTARGKTLSAPARSRLISNRFATSRASLSSDSSAVASSSSRSSVVQRTSVLRRLLTAALAEASGWRSSAAAACTANT